MGTQEETEEDVSAKIHMLIRDHLPERVSPSPSEDMRSRDGSIRARNSATDLKELEELGKTISSAGEQVAKLDLGSPNREKVHVTFLDGDNEDGQEEPDVVTPFVIGVTGASASGKTTVCEKIIQGIGDHRCVLLSLDWFYHGLPPNVNSADYNFDHPDAIDFNYLHDVLKLMQNRKQVEVPTYDFRTHSRTDHVLLNAADVIIVEGILTFYPRFIRKLMHMKIFVEEDADVCLCRRIRRDVELRGRTLGGVLMQYEKFVKRSYDEFIFPTKRWDGAQLSHPPDRERHLHMFRDGAEDICSSDKCAPEGLQPASVVCFSPDMRTSLCRGAGTTMWRSTSSCNI